MTLSGPTRLLAAAGAVVALTITAPAEAVAHARPRASRPWRVPQPHPGPGIGAEQQHGNGPLLVGAQRPGHRGPQPAEGCHVRPAEHRGEGRHDGRPAVLTRPSAARWSKNDQVRNRTAYSYLYFVPSAKQRNAGRAGCGAT